MIAGAGMLLGIPGALVLTRALRGMLYGVAPADPTTYLAARLLLGVVAMAAAYVPAHRATRIEPTVALRSD